MAPRNSMLDKGGATDSEDDLATATTNAQHRTKISTTALKAKTMPTTRRNSTTTATKRKAPTSKPQNREALKDRTNIQHGSEVEEGEDDEYGGKPQSKRAKTSATQKTRAPVKSKHSTARRGPAMAPLAVIPETQPDPQYEDVSQSIEYVDDEGASMDVTAIPTPPQVSRFVQRPRSTSVQPQPALHARPSARSASVQPGYPPPRERSASASGNERERRGGDPELRRQLNDVSRKHETLRLKYQTLQEIDTSKETNFDKLRRETDVRAKAANDTIAALRKEVAELKKAAVGTGSKSNSEPSADLQKQISALNSANSHLATEKSTLESSLQTSQNQVKSLEAMLTAARQQVSNHSISQTNSKAATDATKVSTLPPNATEAQKEAKMKENLYSDLTGLIVRGIKRVEGEDTYDCIQTGRNGTLHFHLSIRNDAGVQNPKTPSNLSYEDAEFAYEPFLDEGRDKDLIELLPDYLAEEICFPRRQAVKFYEKICESMTKKIVIED